MLTLLRFPCHWFCHSMVMFSCSHLCGSQCTNVWHSMFSCSHLCGSQCTNVWHSMFSCSHLCGSQCTNVWHSMIFSCSHLWVSLPTNVWQHAAWQGHACLVPCWSCSRVTVWSKVDHNRCLAMAAVTGTELVCRGNTCVGACCFLSFTGWV